VGGVVSVGWCRGELAGGAYFSVSFVTTAPSRLVLSSLIVPPSLIYPSSFPALAYTPHAAIYPRADNRWHLLPCLREAHGCRCVAVCVRVESLRAALQILRCSQTADARGPSLRTRGLVRCSSTAPRRISPLPHPYPRLLSCSPPTSRRTSFRS
jgi:hypothetical protein